MELIGRVYEANIFISNIWVRSLIDTGAQLSTITQDFSEQHGYDIHPVKQMLCLEGTGGFSIPYPRYIGAIVRIPLIKDYEEYVPMLVLKSFAPFSSQVPVQLGTMVLDRGMVNITVEELADASSAIHQTYMSTMVTAGAASAVELGGQETPYIDTPLVTTKSIMIPPSFV